MEQKMSMARSDDNEGATRQQDEYGNLIPQPSTLAMYGGPTLKEGGAALDDAFATSYYGGRESEARGPEEQHEVGVREGDMTKRHGSTTGEHAEVGVGLSDHAHDKLANIGGFKDDPGHITTTGQPLEGSK